MIGNTKIQEFFFSLNSQNLYNLVNVFTKRIMKNILKMFPIFLKSFMGPIK